MNKKVIVEGKPEFDQEWWDIYPEAWGRGGLWDNKLSDVCAELSKGTMKHHGPRRLRVTVEVVE